MKGYFDKGRQGEDAAYQRTVSGSRHSNSVLECKNKIYKGSKTTYGAWADRHGFKWAEGSIPEEWYNEMTEDFEMARAGHHCFQDRYYIVIRDDEEEGTVRMTAYDYD